LLCLVIDVCFAQGSGAIRSSMQSFVLYYRPLRQRRVMKLETVLHFTDSLHN
jgi:hypothetical protein